MGTKWSCFIITPQKLRQMISSGMERFGAAHFVNQAMETFPDRCVRVRWPQWGSRKPMPSAVCSWPLAQARWIWRQQRPAEAATRACRWCRMRSLVFPKQETALLLENCLPFHYPVYKTDQNPFTADKIPEYLLIRELRCYLTSVSLWE